MTDELGKLLAQLGPGLVVVKGELGESGDGVCEPVACTGVGFGGERGEEGVVDVLAGWLVDRLDERELGVWGRRVGFDGEGAEEEEGDSPEL